MYIVYTRYCSVIDFKTYLQGTPLAILLTAIYEPYTYTYMNGDTTYSELPYRALPHDQLYCHGVACFALDDWVALTELLFGQVESNLDHTGLEQVLISHQI